MPHNATLNLLAAVESHQVPPELTGDARSALTDKRERLLILLHYCCDCYEHPWLEGGSKECESCMGGGSSANLSRIAAA